MATIAKNNESLNSVEKIDAAISNIRTKGAKLRNDCHDVLVAIFDHYAGKGNGDRSRLNMLLLAVNDTLGSSQSAAMVQWVNDFIPSLKYNPDMKPKAPGVRQIDKFETVSGEKGMTAEQLTAFRGIKDVQNYPYGKPDAANHNKRAIHNGNGRDLEYYKLEREVSQKPFDLVGTIIALVKRAEKVRTDQITAGEKPTVALAQIVELKKLSEHIKEYKDAPSELDNLKKGETKVEAPKVEPVSEGEKQEETPAVPVTSNNPDANQGEEKAA